jgi:NitT/TauT family transport system substrate-binding protein
LLAVLAASGLPETLSNDAVTISLQPAFHGIPIYAAQEFGWFEEAGLNVTITFYSSGAPQIEDAVENDAWDLGILGSVPAVIGGSQGIVTVGINNDESAVVEVIGNPSITEYPPLELTTEIFGATPQSTGELLLLRCLVMAGINFTDNNIQHGSQSELQSLLAAEDISYASLWPPNNYIYREQNPNPPQVFCSGANVNSPILGGLVVRDEWAKENPQLVARVLAVYLKAVGFMQNKQNFDATIDLSRNFYASAGVPSISDQAMETDLLLRPLYNLDQQLSLMSRATGLSVLDQHYYDLEQFLFDYNVTDDTGFSPTYVSDMYMKLVSQDPELREMAYSELAGDSGASTAMDSANVSISIQPVYWGIPIFAAKELGWFEEVGLNVDISIYDSGGPQIEDAVQNQAWDFGILGSVPAVLGSSQGITTIGINNDESDVTEVIGGPGISDWPPKSLSKGMFGATPSSTGELLLLKCLVESGINFTEENIQYGSQGELQEFLTDGSVTYGSLWSPNTYTFREGEPDATVFCSGADVQFPILGGLVIREDWGQSNQDLVAKVLSIYLRAVGYLQNHENADSAVGLSQAFYAFAGVPPISDAALKTDLRLRTLFNLDQQIGLMDRNSVNGGVSDLDEHYNELEAFLQVYNVTQDSPGARSYILDDYMLLVSANPTLRNYAYMELSRKSEVNITAPPTTTPPTDVPSPTEPPSQETSCAIGDFYRVALASLLVGVFLF